MRGWFLVSLVVAIFAFMGVLACGVRSSDLKAFAATQEASNTQIALAINALGKNVISPQEAELVVNSAIATNQKALTVTLSRMQEDILSWWQVVCMAAAAAFPVVAGGLTLLNKQRNKTSEVRVSAVLEKQLSDERLAKVLKKILQEKGTA